MRESMSSWEDCASACCAPVTSSSGGLSHEEGSCCCIALLESADDGELGRIAGLCASLRVSLGSVLLELSWLRAVGGG